MTQGPDRILPHEIAQTAVELMHKNHQSSLLIGTEQEAVGIISESDIVRKVVAEGLDPKNVKASDIMSSPLIAVDVSTPLHEIYYTMARNGIRHLFITDQGKQLGFVSVKDILRKSPE